MATETLIQDYLSENGCHKSPFHDVAHKFDVKMENEFACHTINYIQEEYQSNRRLNNVAMNTERTESCLVSVKEEPHEMMDYEENNEIKAHENITNEVNIKDDSDNTEKSFINIKEESCENFTNTLENESTNLYLDCQICGQEYDDYCCTCPMLLHILHNSVPKTINDRAKKTIPYNILEIRELYSRLGVFVLKSIPKDIIFGPFDGLACVQSTTGCTWKIRNGKLAESESKDFQMNWMQYINSAEKISYQNLSVFQYRNDLYCRSSRKINIGEELLAYYGDEHAKHSDTTDKEIYFHPIAEDKFGKVYACTLCCLGFNADIHLLKHKTKCPHVTNTITIKDIVQCNYCKIYLDETEYTDYHLYYCSEIYERKSAYPATTERKDGANNKINQVSVNGNNKTDGHKYNCPKCTYKTNHKSHYTRHLFVHDDVKPFKCVQCPKTFTANSSLQAHIKERHSSSSEKEFKCAKCSYQTNFKNSLKEHLYTHYEVKPFKCEICQRTFAQKEGLRRHLYTHEDVKPFECEFCLKRFTQQSHLNVHVKTMHMVGEKEYKCAKCGYQTNRKDKLRQHLYVHDDVKPLKCETCHKGFIEKKSLREHIKEKHVEGEEKDYKCPLCPYETNRKTNLRQHSYVHDVVKQFECADCDYRTNRKNCFQRHLYVHYDVKPFECEICHKGFVSKRNVAVHMQEKHATTDEKKHKCPKCEYQTNRTDNMKQHLVVHENIKPFECHVCSKRFTQKGSLNVHMKTVHRLLFAHFS